MAHRTRAFTLIELLLVMGLILLLIGLLLPTLSKSRAQGSWVKCQSNLRQIGLLLQIYANNNRGWLFPPGLGNAHPREVRWPIHIFTPPVWNPPLMLCPADIEPAEEHSYLLNDHLVRHNIRVSSKIGEGVPTSEVIVMGEKRSSFGDYYMNRNDYRTRVEPWRHGVKHGSNYLFMDNHVASVAQQHVVRGLDPWDVPPPPTEPTE